MASTLKPETGNSGSPTNGGPVVYLAVATLRRTHGIRGIFLVDILTDFPERLKPGAHVYLGERKQPLKITSRSMHNDGLLLGFEGIRTPEQATRLRGQTLYVRADDRPSLPEGEFYHHQILGLNVIDENDVLLGSLTEILTTGANDVYVVTTPETPAREILLPAIQQVILDVNLETRTIRVHLLPGLLDEAESSDEPTQD